MRPPLLIILTLFSLVGCATATATERLTLIDEPVECVSAQGDLETLESARPSSIEQARSVLQLLTPVGLVTGAVTGTLGDRAKVATGGMSREIDDKIDAIEDACAAPLSSDPNEAEKEQNVTR